ESGIGEARPATERLAMLNLLFPPAARDRLKGRIVVKDAAEIARVVAAVLLDEARGFDDAQDLGIDLGAVEAMPGNIVERPEAHGSALRCYSGESLKYMGTLDGGKRPGHWVSVPRLYRRAPQALLAPPRAAAPLP